MCMEIQYGKADSYWLYESQSIWVAFKTLAPQTKIAEPVYQHYTSHISEDLYQFDCYVHKQKDNLDNNEEVNNFCSLVGGCM